MRHSWISILVVALMLLFAAVTVNAQSFSPLRARTDEILVKVKSGLSDAQVDAMHAKLRGHIAQRYRHLGWQRIKLPSELNVSDAVEKYKQQIEVVDAEPNYIYRTTAVPNDPSMNQLWGLTKIQAPLAWDISTGSPNVVVAVIDSGIDYTHSDLHNNIWVNPGEVAGNGSDDDLDGYVDDVYGINTVNSTSNPMDDYGHGTHVAGIIGAVGNNGQGIAGINWSVKLMALKFIGTDGTGDTANAIACYDYAISIKQHGVNIRVINDSWGGGGFSQPLLDAINAAGNAGMLTVVAAGNDAVNTDVSPDYPSDYNSPYIISVAASDTADNPASFSNYGVTSVDLAAPGVQILSTLPGSNFGFMTGTSMATPYVSGAAALLAAKYPSLSAGDIKNTLLSTVDKLPQWAGKSVSGGRLNLLRALQSPGGIISAPSATRQPDLLVRSNANATFIGDNIYSGSNETVAAQLVPGSTTIYQLALQNDGNASDSFLVSGPASGNGWMIRYFNASTGGTEITNQITGSGWQSGTMTAGASLPLRVEITASSSVTAGTMNEVTVTAKSMGDTVRSDTVKMDTTIQVIRSPLASVTLTINYNSPQRINTAIALKASATGGGAEFEFRIGTYSSTHLTWYTLRNYGTYPVTVWYPTKPGSYQIMVYARVPGSSSNFDVYANRLFTITP